ncbi:MAG: hypothetical protein K2W95_23835 [Candidatus Obscuribacterales bacterium]|nr:hypothetical protein [Candidatus Obscuribacterales bacterium]
MNLQRLFLSLLTISLILIASSPASGQKKPPGVRQYIFSRSTTESSSSYLGVKAVPAYVALGGQNRRGIYITGVGGSLARSMGLRPGMVLLTLDNRVVESSETADNILASRSPGQIDFAAVQMNRGQPQYVPGSCRFDGSRAIIGSAGANMFRTAGRENSKPLEKSSIAELEKYAIQLINESRSKERASAVSENSALTRLARDYAEYMVNRGNFSHVDPDGRDPQVRAKQAGIKCGVYENLSFHTRNTISDKDCIKACHEQMMAEPPNQHNHRYNILLPEHELVGVGIARDDGKIMMVHEFTNSTP